MRRIARQTGTSETGAWSFMSSLLNTTTHAYKIVLVVEIALNRRQRNKCTHEGALRDAVLD